MRLLRLLFVLPAFAATTAFAQGGINLEWSDCTQGTPIFNRMFVCNTNTGSTMDMVVSVVPPAVMPAFDAARFQVFSMSNSLTLPDWWQVAPGQCRAGAVTPSFDPGTFPALYCRDLWGGASPLSAYSITQDIAHGAWRLIASGALGTPSPITPDMVNSEELNVAIVRVSRAKSTGAGACAGCLTGACFLLERIELTDSANQLTYFVTNPGVNSWVQYNGGTFNYACYVPTVNRSWGAIKDMYR